MSTSEIPFDNMYKPGGTITTILNNAVCRYVSKHSDAMGRWSTISMSGKRGRIIHFITVYQLVDKATNGPFTVHQQQVASLRLSDRTITPRKAFIVDLTIYLRSIKTSNSEVVIMGDLNEVVGLSESGFNKITNEFDLVDVMAHFHSITHEVATYSRGSKRIDYIFCSSNLIPAI